VTRTGDQVADLQNQPHPAWQPQRAPQQDAVGKRIRYSHPTGSAQLRASAVPLRVSRRSAARSAAASPPASHRLFGLHTEREMATEATGEIHRTPSRRVEHDDDIGAQSRELTAQAKPPNGGFNLRIEITCEHCTAQSVSGPMRSTAWPVAASA
jgi:hypothetical protein